MKGGRKVGFKRKLEGRVREKVRRYGKKGSKKRGFERKLEGRG